ncbi:MAG: SDR family oxidoreductase [Anaerolineaceae bacterium]|nr:SDR family oxidoreductase [Anaerolineaceae bacterium]
MGTLDGKRILVTGGASGIGRAAAMLFAEEGGNVVIADRNSDDGQAVADAIGPQAAFITCDVTRAVDCERAVNFTLEKLAGLDILLNCAGTIVRRSVVDLDESDWDRVMDVNAKSVYLLSKYAIPAMQVGGGGSIINISSGWGLVGGPDAAVYCASKGAVVLLTKAMAIDFGAHNIRVNCLCPGDTDTPMLREEAQQLGQAEGQFMLEAANRPLGRVGTPREIAQAALFLASDASSYITGATLVVDGGGLAGG